MVGECCWCMGRTSVPYGWNRRFNSSWPQNALGITSETTQAHDIFFSLFNGTTRITTSSPGDQPYRRLFSSRRKRECIFSRKITCTGLLSLCRGKLIVKLSIFIKDQDPDGFDLEVDFSFFEEEIWPAIAHRVPSFESIKVNTRTISILNNAYHLNRSRMLGLDSTNSTR